MQLFNLSSAFVIWFAVISLGDGLFIGQKALPYKALYYFDTEDYEFPSYGDFRRSDVEVYDETKGKRICQGESPCGWLRFKDYQTLEIDFFQSNNKCKCPTNLACARGNKNLQEQAFEYICRAETDADKGDKYLIKASG